MRSSGKVSAFISLLTLSLRHSLLWSFLALSAILPATFQSSLFFFFWWYCLLVVKIGRVFFLLWLERYCHSGVVTVPAGTRRGSRLPCLLLRLPLPCQREWAQRILKNPVRLMKGRKREMGRSRRWFFFFFFLFSFLKRRIRSKASGDGQKLSIVHISLTREWSNCSAFPTSRPPSPLLSFKMTYLVYIEDLIFFFLVRKCRKYDASAREEAVISPLFLAIVIDSIHL